MQRPLVYRQAHSRVVLRNPRPIGNDHSPVDQNQCRQRKPEHGVERGIGLTQLGVLQLLRRDEHQAVDAECPNQCNAEPRDPPASRYAKASCQQVGVERDEKRSGRECDHQGRPGTQIELLRRKRGATDQDPEREQDRNKEPNNSASPARPAFSPGFRCTAAGWSSRPPTGSGPAATLIPNGSLDLCHRLFYRFG